MGDTRNPNMWRQKVHYRCRRMPVPIHIALKALMVKHGFEAIEDVIYKVLRRDEEFKKALRFVMEERERQRRGKPVVTEGQSHEPV